MLFLNSEFLSLGAPCSLKAISPIMGALLFISFPSICHDRHGRGREKKKTTTKKSESHLQVTIRSAKYFKVVTNIHRILCLKGLIL